MTLPETRYARSGDVRIAYQVIAEGDRITFSQACAYPDGLKVLCLAMCDLKIVHQTDVQARDE